MPAVTKELLRQMHISASERCVGLLLSCEGIVLRFCDNYGITGYSSDSILGTCIFDLIHAGFILSCVVALSVAVESNQTVHVKSKFRHSNGNWMMFDNDAKKIFMDGEVVGYGVKATPLVDIESAIFNELLEKELHKVAQR